jgi:hypothetical protein
VSKGPDQAFGMSKSAWSFREFSGILEEALKNAKPS